MDFFVLVILLPLLGIILLTLGSALVAKPDFWWQWKINKMGFYLYKNPKSIQPSELYLFSLRVFGSELVIVGLCLIFRINIFSLLDRI